MDHGFAGTRSDLRTEITGVRTEIGDGRSESRADFRMLLGVLLAMFMTMLLGFAGIMVTLLLNPL